MGYRITDPRNGRRVWIPDGEELAARWQAVAVCPHENVELRLWTNANSTQAVCDQCLSCGERRGNPKRHPDRNALPPANEALRDTWSQHLRDTRRVLEIEFIDRQLVADGKVSLEYQTYLASDKWRAKRQLVLKRCGGLCEGCGANPATQVHHLTYEHIFDELLFELVGICDVCHERVHPVEAGSEDSEFDPIGWS